MNEDIIVPVIAIGGIFIAMPWLLLHYVTKWKQAPKITREDENLLDELYHLARRLDERVQTVERIVAAENPDFGARLGRDTHVPATRLADHQYSKGN